LKQKASKTPMHVFLANVSTREVQIEVNAFICVCDLHHYRNANTV